MKKPWEYTRMIYFCFGAALLLYLPLVTVAYATYGDGVERPRADALLNGGALPRLIDFALLAGPSGFRPWASCGLTVAPSSAPAEPLVLHMPPIAPRARGPRHARQRRGACVVPWSPCCPREPKSQRPII